MKRPLLDPYTGPNPCPTCSGYGHTGNPLCGALYTCQGCDGTGQGGAPAVDPEPVTRTAPTTIPCASPSPRRRPFPVWLAVVLGFGLGAGVGQLWRLLALFVVLGVATGCIEEMGSWHLMSSEVGELACFKRPPIARSPSYCFPCRTTDFVDARRVCDAAGIRKGGGK